MNTFRPEPGKLQQRELLPNSCFIIENKTGHDIPFSSHKGNQCDVNIEKKTLRYDSFPILLALACER